MDAPAEFGRSRRVSALPLSLGGAPAEFVPAVPWVVVPIYPSLGAPTIEFGHSRRVWALLDGDDLYLRAYVYWVVSIIRHCGFYAPPRARTHEIDLAGTGSGIVEAGCCDTWVYCLGVTMEAEAETFKK